MTVLGKRKKAQSTVSQEEAEAIFRRHFEAQFQPLDLPQTKSRSTEANASDDNISGSEEDTEVKAEGDELSDDDDDGSAWGGISGDEVDSEESDDDNDDEPAIEVIDHSVPQAPNPESMSKSELKAFMSSRPPEQTNRSKSTATTSSSSSKQSSTLAEDAPSLLAQDLELRRLLSESHLLAPRALTNTSAATAASSEPKLFAAGRIRQKATDLRTQALGSKESILNQQKMPMNRRKGINAAAEARETRRRREAKENNVILEREASDRKRRKRDRGKDFGLDRPGVGRMRGAQLKISERDVRSIEGSRDTFGRKGGDKGRRR